jgi:hypothetical protein
MKFIIALMILGMIVPACALELSDIQNTIDKVYNSHVYQRNIFDCTQFSQRFNSEMDKLGIKNICVFGYYKCDGLSLHNWSEIELNGKTIRVDATNGYVIDEDTYLLCYKPYFRSQKCR